MSAPVTEPATVTGWRGPILPINTESGDGRVYVLDDDNALDVRPLPLPLCAQDEIAEGHDGGKVIGRIDRVWVEDSAVWAEGSFDVADANSAEWARRLAEGYAGWVSADMDRTQYTQIPRDVDGNEVTAEELATGAVDEGTPLLRVSHWRIMGATLVSQPAFAEAKIAPAEPAPVVEPITAALTAAGVVYKVSDFADPQLDGPTALTVTPDGRVFGHLAIFGTCHIGYAGSCVTPPHSASDYAYFHQGIVSTDQGDLPVGKLTLGTGHAALGEDANRAAAHYDNTGTATCVVRMGEDQTGIWFAGRVLPAVSDARVDEMRRGGVSGDWRSIGGTLELVAALCVNTPGFPVPRTESLAAGGHLALVAAGVVANAPTGGTRAPCSAPTESSGAALLASLDARVFGPDLAALDAQMNAARLDQLDRRMRAAQLARLDERMANPGKARARGAGTPPASETASAGASGDHSGDAMIALVPTLEDAQRLAVDGGEPVDELHCTIAYYPNADDIATPAAFVDSLDGFDGSIAATISGTAVFGGDNPCSVYLVQADGLAALHEAIAPESGSFDAFVPHITAAYDPDVVIDGTARPITFDRIRVSMQGQTVDVPLDVALAAAAAPRVQATGKIMNWIRDMFGRFARRPGGAGQEPEPAQSGRFGSISRAFPGIERVDMAGHDARSGKRVPSFDEVKPKMADEATPFVHCETDEERQILSEFRNAGVDYVSVQHGIAGERSPDFASHSLNETLEAKALNANDAQRASDAPFGPRAISRNLGRAANQSRHVILDGRNRPVDQQTLRDGLTSFLNSSSSSYVDEVIVLGDGFGGLYWSRDRD